MPRLNDDETAWEPATQAKAARWRGPTNDFEPLRREMAEGMLAVAMQEGNPDAVRGYVQAMLQMGMDARAAFERLVARSPNSPYRTFEEVEMAIQQEQEQETGRQQARIRDRGMAPPRQEPGFEASRRLIQGR